ncbi:MAG: imidazoleglycerol-phosphate dehydratase HisB [Bradymonadaceae bacterium]
MTERSASVERTTGETDVSVSLDLEGAGDCEVSTGVGFLDHMLETFGYHARFDLQIDCEGDLHVDDHHTVEDISLALGRALDRALGDRAGIARFGEAHVPMDEALARAVVDLSGRPYAVAELSLDRPSIGELACENVPHVFRSVATEAGAAVHVDVLRGSNDHHRIEAAFKASALAFRRAVRRTGGDEVPSTKGVIE